MLVARDRSYKNKSSCFTNGPKKSPFSSNKNSFNTKSSASKNYKPRSNGPQKYYKQDFNNWTAKQRTSAETVPFGTTTSRIKNAEPWKTPDEKDYMKNFTDAFESMGLGVEDTGYYDDEFPDDGYDESVDELDDIFSNISIKERDPKAIRRNKELQNFKKDNRPDFSDFTFFDRPATDQSLLEFEENNRDVIFYLMHASWRFNKNDGTMLEFGGTLKDTDQSVCVRVTGFRPNFQIKRPQGWSDRTVKEFMESLNIVARTQYQWTKFDKNTVADLPLLYVEWEPDKAEELADYNTEGSQDYIKIHCSWPRAAAAARHILNEPYNYNWFYKNHKFNVFDADIDYTSRYFNETNNQPCRWYLIKGLQYELIKYNSGSRAKLVLKCDYRQMVMLTDAEHDKKLPNWKTISFDTEWKNRPFIFPVKYEDPIIVISMSAYFRNDPKKRVSILMVYVKDGILPPEKDIPKFDYFYWFRSEPGLLKAFWDFIVLVADPDFMIDFNGAGFDWPYIVDAGKFYFGPEYACFGRDEKQKTKFNQTPWRNNVKYTMEIYQRNTIDMLKYVMNTPMPGKHFNDWRLGTVSWELLKETKVEFDVNLMDAKWNNVNTVGEIWAYGDKDAELPGKLESNLNVIYTYIGMAQMTGLTFQKAIDRGAGAKIKGFVQRLCNGKGFKDTKLPKIIFECFKKMGRANNDIIDSCAKKVDGACVIDPKRGYYRNYVYVLDFNSMYPSIIIYLNLCISTFISQGLKILGILDAEKYFTLPNIAYDDDKIRWNTCAANPSFVKSSVKMGVLSEAETILWAWRKEIKKKLDDAKKMLKELEAISKESKKEEEALKKSLNDLKTGFNASSLSPEQILEAESKIRVLEEKIGQIGFEILVLDGLQNAIKIIMNGIFGQTIFSESSFFKEEIGSTILTFGRYMINYVRLFINTTYKLGKTNKNGVPYDFELEAIYGDTDSVMVHIAKWLGHMDYPRAVSIGRLTETDVNQLFEQCAPIKMEMEKFYKRFLLINPKNYIGLKIDGFENDEKVTMDRKGVKHKKKGTSPNCQDLGNTLDVTAILKDDPEGALNLVRSIIVALRRRQVTLSKVIYSQNIGKDLSVAIYYYMLRCIQEGNKPPPETEKVIRDMYTKASQTDKDKGGSATPGVVYCYQALCKDPKRWIGRGTTIHYIYREGINKSAKRDLVCSVEDALTYDIPYNVGFYEEEVMRISRKIMALIVGDTDVDHTPIFNRLIASHESVCKVPISQHISFFESRFGTKTVKVSADNNNLEELEKPTGDPSCDRVIKRLVQKYKAGGEKMEKKDVAHYFKYSFERCAVCRETLHPFEKLMCQNCSNQYGVTIDKLETRLKNAKADMYKGWETCKKCINSDAIDPMDCINFTCHNFSTRIDNTKEYYQLYHEIKELKEHMQDPTWMEF